MFIVNEYSKFINIHAHAVEFQLSFLNSDCAFSFLTQIYGLHEPLVMSSCVCAICKTVIFQKNIKIQSR